MKKRNVFLMLVVFVLGMFAVCFSAKNVKAMEIAEDGEYTLVLSTTWDEDEYIDGKIFKIFDLIWLKMKLRLTCQILQKE